MTRAQQGIVTLTAGWALVAVVQGVVVALVWLLIVVVLLTAATIITGRVIS